MNQHLWTFEHGLKERPSENLGKFRRKCLDWSSF